MGTPTFDHASVAHVNGYNGNYGGIDDVNSYVGQAFSGSSPLVGKQVAGADMYLQRDIGTVGNVSLVLLSAGHVQKGVIGTVDVSTLGETGIGGAGTPAWNGT